MIFDRTKDNFINCEIIDRVIDISSLLTTKSHNCRLVYKLSSIWADFSYTHGKF